jgi:hypothetical protein
MHEHSALYIRGPKRGFYAPCICIVIVYFVRLQLAVYTSTIIDSRKHIFKFIQLLPIHFLFKLRNNIQTIFFSPADGIVLFCRNDLADA